MPPRRNTEKRDRKPDQKRSFSARKASRYLEGVKYIDKTDYDLLRRFLTEHGKIVPARLSGTSAKQQRRIRDAVRRARVMGLMP